MSTLDHHLPKHHFPLLAVTPANLVPACRDCNTTKLASWSAVAEEQTLHPYFDDVDKDVWLKAEVTLGPAVVFYPDPPGHWPAVLAARLRHHFTVFDLAPLYAAQAATEIAEIAWALQQVHDAGGPLAVRDHLRREAESRGRVRPNGWPAPPTTQWPSAPGTARADSR